MTDNTETSFNDPGRSLDFETMFMSLPTAYIVFDAKDDNWTILEQNLAHAAMTMVDRQDVIGKPLLEAFPDNSAEYKKTGHSAIVESIRKVVSTGATDVLPVFRYDIKDYDGVIQTKHWRISHSPLIRGDEVVAVLQESKDITDRKLTERYLHVLAEANTQLSAAMGYRQTLEAIAAIIVPDVADWCSIDLLEGDTIQQVVIAHKDPEKVEWARKLRQEFGPVDRDASSGTPWVIRTGQTEHIPEITDDMLQAAATSEDQLKLLRDVGMTSAITVPLKIDGTAIGAISFISTDPQRHYGDNDVDIIKGLASRASLAVYNANLFEEAETEITERKKLHQELKELNAALESRVSDRTKQLEMTNQGLKREIERRHAAEAEIKEASAELARSNQELQDFAYVASHDLQEPLRKIRAFGDILEAEYGNSLGEGSEYLVRMQSAAARMSTLIQDLLALSRVSTREQTRQKVDLGTIAHNVVVDLELQIQELQATVTIGDLPTVYIDETHMRQIFHNLIGNALKFNRPNVPPVISIEQCGDADSDMYTICVKDNGIGFDERYLDRIFSVFQRLHGKDEYEGTGIGLAVVRKIAERYGGTITASSKKNHGSTFKLSIPKVLEENQDD